MFDGEDVTRLPAHRRVVLGMARTFQITEIFPELTVARTCGSPSRWRPAIGCVRGSAALPPRRCRAASRRFSALTGLGQKGDRLVGELSHGDQRAAEIAMALALRPRLLLLDEPTAGMGEQETYEIAELIRRLHRDGNLTIVLIEHDMRVVFNLADRITVLDQGRLLADGTPAEIAANEAVQAAYLGKAE